MSHFAAQDFDGADYDVGGDMERIPAPAMLTLTIEASETLAFTASGALDALTFPPMPGAALLTLED